MLNQFSDEQIWEELQERIISQYTDFLIDEVDNIDDTIEVDTTPDEMWGVVIGALFESIEAKISDGWEGVVSQIQEIALNDAQEHVRYEPRRKEIEQEEIERFPDLEDQVDELDDDE